ncbi:GNAT family N-acetyltransferase [Aestuariivita sp.]|jgi:RimJ/RimL family protein N-acetyltransferase|uniref:GNAT family N-acetyltransferase n=1 Tax=Aestuariivita sp. TaxID=1872407 RepID=UPI00216FEA38|nr:GNAT family N-acetyltransferase [Aestuariivita sp.]MCE8007116.1 GNAT family N-acetyltransferase [Aestuariivita sp.]
MRHEVRTLTPADQPDWRRLRLDALERYPAAFLTTAGEQRARPSSVDRAALSGGTWRGLFLSHEMIGIGSLRPMQQQACAHRMELGAFYVVETHWGSDAAQLFIDTIEAEARRRGATQLELSVAEDNPRAIRFYERNGFERFGVQPRAIILDGVPQDDFFYVKMLDR